MSVWDINVACITINESRAKEAIESLNKLGFTNVSVLNGVNGKEISPEKLKSLLSIRAHDELTHGRYVHEALSSIGSVGCYLSHCKAWKLCIESGEPLIIVEDDFRSMPGAKEKIAEGFDRKDGMNTDIFRFQYRENYDYIEYPRPHPFNRLITREEGLVMYYITPKTAKILLENAFPIEMQVDHYVNVISNMHRLNHIGLNESIFDDPRLPSEIEHNSIKKYRSCYSLETIILLLIASFILFKFVL